jgi:leucyl aminopeptidase
VNLVSTFSSESVQLHISPTCPEGIKDILLILHAENTPESTLAMLSRAGFDAPNVAAALGDLKLESTSAAPACIYESGYRFFIISLGKLPDKPFDHIYKQVRRWSVQQRQKIKPELCVAFEMESPLLRQLAVEAITNGLFTGTNQLGVHKMQADAASYHALSGESSTLCFLDAASTEEHEELHESLLEAARRGLHIAAAQLESMHLINLPSNIKTPPYMADWARAWQRRYPADTKLTVLSGDEIEQEGLHALAAVNRGSEYPAQFIVMVYEPRNTSPGKAETIGLVGKGVTFDTGGLSIKTSAGMYFMKSDMGGAAAVFGFMEAVARLKLEKRFIAVVPVTDNLIDAKAFKPSDVIQSYSGKTIEIMDTDAEGRLLLADGLAWLIKHHKTDHIVDLATLTGATVRALGYHAGGLFSNDDSLASRLSRTGLQCGEHLWRFPLWDAYAEDCHSDVADVRNLSGKPIAGSIMAAKFLENFIGDHESWAHLDIAGVSFGDNEFGKHKNATGFGVRLLIEAFEGI